ncbi:uncharacterized protein RAG0_01663 [Rhynchosporium agropyri]|uniref:Uncharacterized protein n=1 Tax=Rhynchosporium agropyri TaxID=914238 RepID=A0A1E1JXT0_9HELO|nr:uncharacterized protein RAG0_01663 [Rhynchosporium agropyri]
MNAYRHLADGQILTRADHDQRCRSALRLGEKWAGMSALMILSKPGKAYFLALSSFAMIPTNSALIDRVVDLFGALSGRSEAHPFSRVLTYLTREKVKAKAKKRLVFV